MIGDEQETRKDVVLILHNIIRASHEGKVAVRLAVQAVGAAPPPQDGVEAEQEQKSEGSRPLQMEACWFDELAPVEYAKPTPPGEIPLEILSPQEVDVRRLDSHVLMFCVSSIFIISDTADVLYICISCS